MNLAEVVSRVILRARVRGRPFAIHHLFPSWTISRTPEYIVRKETEPDLPAHIGERLMTIYPTTREDTRVKKGRGTHE